jgi:hypothetical protein
MPYPESVVIELKNRVEASVGIITNIPNIANNNFLKVALSMCSTNTLSAGEMMHSTK